LHKNIKLCTGIVFVSESQPNTMINEYFYDNSGS